MPPKAGAAGIVMDDLLSEFIAETQESLAALSTVIIKLEADPSDRALLDQLCRFFHTVKGSCGFFNLPRFERLSHAAEDVLADFRSGDHVPNDSTISAVLAVMDRISELCAAVRAGESLPDRNDEELIAILRRCHYQGHHHQAHHHQAHSRVQWTQQQDEGAEVTSLSSGDPADDDGPVSRALPTTRTVRLPLRLIDRLMDGVSDMVLSRNELARAMRTGTVDPDSIAAFERLSSCISDMQESISKTRMQRVDRLFQAVPRMVRDLSRDLGKVITLSVDGGDVEMDREMIEMVVDPLTHIVRNSISHGIETPQERLAAGKPEAGFLSLTACQSGSQIVIEVTDDGRGIDVDAVAEKIIASGAMTAAEVAALDHQARLALIFTPGLSTARTVTPVSGRGVGMDVVRANIERLGGSIALQSAPGQGLTISMQVPLTLTIIAGLTLRAGGLDFAIPRSAVMEIIHETNPTVSVEETVSGERRATIRTMRYSMLYLEDVLGRPVERGEGPRTLMLVRSAAGIPYVLGVSQVENHEELVIRPAAPVVMASGLYAGMTLPDNGRPMLLLDAGGIAAAARISLSVESVSAHQREAAADRQVPCYAGLRFTELTGEERIIRLSLVERVETVPVAAFSMVAGQASVSLAGEDIPSVHPVDAALLPEGVKEIPCLHIRDGVVGLCYPVQSVADIHDVPQQLDGTAPDGLIAGVMMLDGAPVEVIDSFALMAIGAGTEDTGDGALPRCIIADQNDIWNREILAPLLIQAGYRVMWGNSASRTPADIIVITDRENGADEAADQGISAATQAGDRPVVRLRSAPVPLGPQDGSIYRYDRAAILGAVATAAGGRGGA